MVKIPTFESEFKKRTGVTDAFTGFSGGEIQAAGQNPSKEIGSAITKFAKAGALAERQSLRLEALIILLRKMNFIIKMAHL